MGAKSAFWKQFDSFYFLDFLLILKSCILREIIAHMIACLAGDNLNYLPAGQKTWNNILMLFFNILSRKLDKSEYFLPKHELFLKSN